MNVFIISGVRPNGTGNGASFVNGRIIDTVSGNCKTWLVYPGHSRSWVLRQPEGRSAIYDNITSMLRNIPRSIDITVQLHSWYPEIFRLIGERSDSKVLLLHSIKKESLIVERALACRFCLPIDFDPEILKCECESNSISIADLVVCVSESDATLVKKHYNVEALVIHNPIEIKYYCNGNDNSIIRSDRHKSKLKIVSIGRLDIRKPVHELFETIKILSRHKEVVFFVIGWGSNEIDNMQLRHDSYHDKWIKSCNLRNIVFLDGLNKTQIMQYLLISDMAIIPSYYDSYSYSTAEALLFSKTPPIVSSRYGPGELQALFNRGVGVEDFSPNSVLKAMDAIGHDSGTCSARIETPSPLTESVFKAKWNSIINGCE